MGNYPACLTSSPESVHDSVDEDSVKVIRVTDGQLFQYPGPVFVKDFVYGFDGFAVFHYSTLKQPLPPETELTYSEVYYLRPWGSQVKSEKAQVRDESGSPAQKVKKVRFVDDEHQPLDRVAVETLPEIPESQMAVVTKERQNTGVVRFKVVMSKKQLAELMSTTKDASALVDRIVAPLLSPKTTRSLSSPTAPWSPSLERIPEIL